MGGLVVFISVLGGISVSVARRGVGAHRCGHDGKLARPLYAECTGWKQSNQSGWEESGRRARVAPFGCSDEQKFQSQTCELAAGKTPLAMRSSHHSFNTTAEVEPTSGDLGQDRALRALRMGVELNASGYNLFVCGLSGTSRGGMIVRMVEEMRLETEPRRIAATSTISRMLTVRAADPAARPGQRIQKGSGIRN